MSDISDNDTISTGYVKTEGKARRSESTITHAHIDRSVSDIAGVLQSHLGQKLVAHMAGLADAKAIGKYARSERTPQTDAEKRLRAAYLVLTIMLDDESAHTARAWFIGMNPQLDGEAPADVIRDGRFKEVLAAVRSYSTGG